MSDDQTIQQKIRDVLANETSAISLSNKLFGPAGLFNQIAQTEADRREIVQTPLYKEAKCRINDLQRKEAVQFAQTVQQTQDSVLGDEVLVKIERS